MIECVKCKEKFPTGKVIDGKRRNLNSRTHCLTCSPFGEHNTKKIYTERPKLNNVNNDTLKICYLCKRSLPSNAFYVSARKISSECKSCCKKRVNDSLRARKKILVDELGGKCFRCGYDRCITALCFHHTDENEKSFQISARLTSNIDALKEEIKKCELLCSNCHLEHHAGYIPD